MTLYDPQTHYDAPPDLETRVHERAQQRLQEYSDEKNHYARLARVFDSADGFEILQWLLSITGYWDPVLHDERALARFELGRLIFNQVSLADLNIVTRLLDHRRDKKLNQLDAEKRQIESDLK